MRRSIFLIWLSLVLMFSMTTLPASANTPASYGLSVSKLKSHNKNGNFYMNFNYKVGSVPFAMYTSVVNSAGKRIFTWPSDSLINQTKPKSYSANYSSLPNGIYTFIVDARSVGATFNWKYNITVNNTYAKFLSTGKVTGSDGSILQKFNFQCKQIKGKAIHFEIYDSTGKKVYEAVGPKRKTNNETGWFTWNYYPTNGGLKCKTGTYTIKYWYDGSNPKQATVKIKN